MRRVGAAVVLMALAGCATKYQNGSGSGGGFTESQLDKNLFRVSVNGNQYTSAERARELALLRSADLTLQLGFSYFVFVESRSREEEEWYTSPVETVSKTSRKANGELVTSTITYGGNTSVSRRPTRVNTVMAYTKKPDVTDVVYNARSLCESLGRKYEATCGTLPAFAK